MEHIDKELKNEADIKAEQIFSQRGIIEEIFLFRGHTFKIVKRRNKIQSKHIMDGIVSSIDSTEEKCHDIKKRIFKFSFISAAGAETSLLMSTAETTSVAKFKAKLMHPQCCFFYGDTQDISRIMSFVEEAKRNYKLA